MAEIKLAGNPCMTSGSIPPKGASAPDFSLVTNDLGQSKLSDFKGKRLILNIFPSIDTDTCATSTRKFNEKASSLDNTIVACVSRDLPFAQKRFCAAEGLDNVVTLSDFRQGEFGANYGLTIVGGPLDGLHSRVVVVIDENGEVLHSEQVGDIVDEPDYEAAIASLS